MNDYHNRLTHLLLEKNEQISYQQARIWIEIIWNDMQLSSHRPAQLVDNRQTEREIRQWIDQYGDVVHEFVHNNPKYEHLFYVNKKYLH